jgi:hypothetical protein
LEAKWSPNLSKITYPDVRRCLDINHEYRTQRILFSINKEELRPRPEKATGLYWMMQAQLVKGKNSSLNDARVKKLSALHQLEYWMEKFEI